LLLKISFLDGVNKFIDDFFAAKPHVAPSELPYEKLSKLRTLHRPSPTQPEKRPFRSAKFLQINWPEPEPTAFQIVRGSIRLLRNFRLYFRFSRAIPKLFREARQGLVHVRHPRL